MNTEAEREEFEAAIAARTSGLTAEQIKAMRQGDGYSHNAKSFIAGAWHGWQLARAASTYGEGST